MYAGLWYNVKPGFLAFLHSMPGTVWMVHVAGGRISGRGVGAGVGTGVGAGVGYGVGGGVGIGVGAGVGAGVGGGLSEQSDLPPLHRHMGTSVI
jgi:hypothetical protein